MAWYIIKTRSGEELKLSSLLLKPENGFESYVPLQNFNREIKGVVSTISRPAISGYVFVKERIGCNYLSCLKLSKGIVSDAFAVRTVDGDIALVSDSEIRLMQLALGASEQFVEFVDRGVIRSGHPIMIIKGDFKGQKALLVRRSRRRYVIVELKSVNLSAVLTLPMDYVEKLETV